MSAANQKSEERMEQIQLNTIKTLVLVGICYMMCWSCNVVYYLMFVLGYPVDFTSDFYHFSVAVVFTNCCLNPFIYALKYKQFQTEAKSLILNVYRKCSKENRKHNSAQRKTTESIYHGEVT